MLQHICDTTAHHNPLWALLPAPLLAPAVTYTPRKENTCPILRPKRLERDNQLLDEAKGIKPREEAKKLHDVRDGEQTGN